MALNAYWYSDKLGRGQVSEHEDKLEDDAQVERSDHGEELAEDVNREDKEEQVATAVEHSSENLYRRKSLSDEIAEARRHYPDNARYFRAQSPSIRHFMDQAANNPYHVSLLPHTPSQARTSQRPVMPPPSLPRANANTAPFASDHPMRTVDKRSSYIDAAPKVTPKSSDLTTKEKRKERSDSECLDYDAAVLQEMSFETLQHEPFDHDPRQSNVRRETDCSVGDFAQHEKLRELKKMSESERTRYFSCQNKDQWSASMSFFQGRLQELLVELDDARKRRREVSSRFEAEIGDRMRTVQEAVDGIDHRLADMRGRARGVLPRG